MIIGEELEFTFKVFKEDNGIRIMFIDKTNIVFSALMYKFNDQEVWNLLISWLRILIQQGKEDILKGPGEA